MRKRRLYRSARAQQAARRPPPPPQHPEVDPHQQAFESGLRHGMELSARQHHQALQAAQNQAIALASHAESRIARAQREAFDRGYSAGMRAAPSQPQEKDTKSNYTFSDRQAARERGRAEGRREVAKSQGADEASIRKKMIDEMVEQCRVISESNPNMASGVNAVRHRIKKLG